jgi:hypothetical protein
MLDQNTTTIITSALTVIGTLGGVVLGVVLSNRYVAQQEKAKRNAAIIEEVYTLLTNITAQILENVNHERSCFEGKQVQGDLLRLQTLISLYLPALKEKFKAFMTSMTLFANEVNGAQQANNPPTVWNIVKEPYHSFIGKGTEIKIELEKLVR